MNIETTYPLEIVLEDGILWVNDCEIKGMDAYKLLPLVAERGESGEGYSTLEIDVKASIYATPYDPGRIMGPPEKCYPPEGGDFDLDELIHEETGVDFCDHLSPAALELIADGIKQQQDRDDDDARGEYLYEQQRDREDES